MNELRVDYERILKNIFAISLASKDFIRNDIDTIYNKNKIEHIECYKNSDIYKTVLNKSLSFEAEKYTEKVIGIIEYNLKINNFSDIENLYKKAFKKIYNNTKNFKEITFYNIMNYISTGLEGNYEALSTFYMAHLNNKLDVDVYYNTPVLNAIRDMVFLDIYVDTNYSDYKIEYFKEDLDKLASKLGIKKKMYTLEEVITDILKKDAENYNKSIIAKIQADTDNIQKFGDIGKYIGSIEGVFKYLQIDSARLAQQTTFTQKEINMVLLNFIYSKELNSFTDSDLAHTVIDVLYITALNKEYKNLKSVYLKDVNEEHLLEVNQLQKDLALAKNEFDVLSEKTKLKEASLESKEKDLLAEIEKLKKENSKLKDEIDESRDLKQEVIKLRNLVFNSEYERENITELDSSIDIEELNKLNIVIAGGTVNWVKKLKAHFPNWNYIGVEQKNNDFTNLKNCDFIFINTKMKHALYFKIKSFISKYDIKYDYLEPLENINMNISSIDSKLKNIVYNIKKY